MARILLSQNLFTILDEEDFKVFSVFNWHATKTKSGFYVVRNKKKSEGRGLLLLHREIMRAPSGLVVDHKNHDTLDNRRENLRLCTQSDNQRNQRIGIANTSGFKGVYYRPSRRKYQAQIKIGGVSTYLGIFDEVEDAALAYNEAAKKHFGEFAFLNKI